MLVYIKGTSPRPSKIQQKPFLSRKINFPPSIPGFEFWSTVKIYTIFLINSSVLSDARQAKLLLFLNHALKGTYFTTGINSNRSERKSFWQSITGHQPSAVMLLHLQFMKLLSSISCFYKRTPDAACLHVFFLRPEILPSPTPEFLIFFFGGGVGWWGEVAFWI